MAAGDELYLRGDSNRAGSVRLLEVPDTDGDGVPDHRLQVERDGLWLDSSLLNPSPGSMPRAGGTMTGALELAGDPTTDLQPVTRRYVEKPAAGTPAAGHTVLGLIGGALRKFVPGSAVDSWLGGQAGEVARLLAGKVAETVSVKDFGAVGDGVRIASGVAMASGSAVVTAPASSFPASIVGKRMVVVGGSALGTLAAAPLAVTGLVLSRQSDGQVTLDTPNGTGTSITSGNLGRCTFGTDDTAAVVAADAYLASVGGGEMTFPRGIYLISNVALSQGTSLRGRSKPLRSADSATMLVGFASGSMISAKATSPATCYGFGISRLELAGSYLATTGVECNRAIGTHLDDAKVREFGTGISLDNCWAAILRNSYFTDCTTTAGKLGEISNGVSTPGSTFSGSPTNLTIAPTTNPGTTIEISGAVIENTSGIGIDIDKHWNVSIRGCYFENLSGATDIRIGNTTLVNTIRIIHNGFSSQSGVVQAINLVRASNCRIDDNRVGSSYTAFVTNQATSVSSCVMGINHYEAASTELNSNSGFVKVESKVGLLQLIGSAFLQVLRTSAGQTLFEGYVSGEANARVSFNNTPQLLMGPGGATAPDTQLVRAAAGTFAVRDSSSNERARLGGAITATTGVAGSGTGLANVGAAINTTGKYQGKWVYNTTDDDYYFAVGAAAASAWKQVNGSGTTINPA